MKEPTGGGTAAGKRMGCSSRKGLRAKGKQPGGEEEEGGLQRGLTR